jgi:hypothetical protein
MIIGEFQNLASRLYEYRWWFLAGFPTPMFLLFLYAAFVQFGLGKIPNVPPSAMYATWMISGFSLWLFATCVAFHPTHSGLYRRQREATGVKQLMLKMQEWWTALGLLIMFAFLFLPVYWLLT